MNQRFTDCSVSRTHIPTTHRTTRDTTNDREKLFTRLINNHTFAIATRVAEVQLQLHRVAVDPQVRRGIPHNSYACELPYKEKICACFQYEFTTGDSVSTIPSCGVAIFFKNIRNLRAKDLLIPVFQEHVSRMELSNA
ncbi:hypothetical protein FNV43_RR10138 [Rhamnella rubrinervis]|uniref:Uncharacterized protein n=1 Tax=Rhamnella rubrinervis TaxID=2594499 RepID=A0A8K0HBS8_9ROSA|nr:hypothetical protein FNV43_RR10138 [Rhamnella rubrinervis]